MTIFLLVMCNRHYIHFQSSRRIIIMCWEITVITLVILSLCPTMYYFSLEFRMGTARFNESSVNCQRTWHFVSSFRTRAGSCEVFSSDALFSILLLLTLYNRTSIPGVDSVSNRNYFFFFFFFFNRHCNTATQLSLSILSRKVFTECLCQRHVKPPTWRTSD